MFECKVPTHLAIILDGNGRWAKRKGLVRSIGHKVGAKTAKDIISYVFDKDVKVLSLFCFSTENWKRNEDEINYLMSIPITYFTKYEEDLIKDNIKVIFSGDLSKLPLNTKLACEKIALKTKLNDKYVLNICLNYGGKDEIVKACKELANKVKNNIISIDDINEDVFENHLYSKDLPMVDLLIRTSNEKRLSNFMLYQLAYAELYFTKVLWPDFNKKCIDKAFKEYNLRKRRFGGV